MAKFRDHEAVKKTTEAFRVDPRMLKIEAEFNLRDLDAPTARESLDELKASILSEGVQVPLEIRMGGDDLFVVSGHRRHKVVMELIEEGNEILTVPAIPEQRAMSEADRVSRLFTLNQGEPLTALEKAEGVRRLLGFGWDRVNIARRLGFKSVQTIANFELLLAAPQEVREAVRGGEVSASNAVEMVRESGPDAGAVLTEARSTAKAAGKKKITKASIASPAKRGRPTAAAVAARAANGDDKGTAASYRFGKAMDLMSGLMVENYSADHAAASYAGLSPDKVTKIIEWMMDFEARFAAKAKGARPLPPVPTTAAEDAPAEDAQAAAE